MSCRGRVHYGQKFGGRMQYDQNYRGDFRKGNFRGTQNYRGQNFRAGYRGNFRNDNVGIGLEKDSIQITSGEMIEEAVDQDQVQEKVPIEIESDAFSVGSMTTLPKTAQIYQIQKKSTQSRYSRCLT